TEQLAGRDPLPDPLPVSAGMEQAFLVQVRALPADSQLLLLVAASEDTGNLPVVLAGAHRLGVGPGAFEVAEARGLVTVAKLRMPCRHPLVRSAVYGAASFTQRRQVHAALAGALEGTTDPDRRAWHLALAAVGPDEAVAEELERSAERARPAWRLCVRS